MPVEIFLCANRKFLTENKQQTLCPQAPDAEHARPVCCLSLVMLGLSTGRGLDPVCAFGVT